MKSVISIFLIIIAVVFFVSDVLAIDDLSKQSSLNRDCKTSRWPYSYKLSEKEFQFLVDNIGKATLVHYLFYEVTKGGSPKLTELLGHYLYTTESNRNLKGFYGLILESSEVKTGKLHKLNKKEVCEAYKFALNLK